MGSQCKGLIHWAWLPKLYLSHRHMPSFLSFSSPSRALLWEDNQNLKNLQGMWHWTVLPALLSLVWAQAWGRQGFRGEIGAERLHFEEEVGCMTPVKAVSFYCWKTLRIPFWRPQAKHFPAQSFSFSFWEKKLILSLWEQLLNNFWKPLFP